MKSRITNTKNNDNCKTILDNAISNNEFELVKQLVNDTEITLASYSLSVAVKHGFIELAKFLYDKFPELYSKHVLNTAAWYGQFELLRWFIDEHKKPMPSNIIYWASINGYFDIIKWLHERGAKCTADAMDNVALSGWIYNWQKHDVNELCSLEMVKWFHEHSTEGCTHAALDNAACNNDIKTMEWLYENCNKDHNDYIILFALNNGAIDAANWLVKHGITLPDDHCVKEMVKRNQIESIKWYLKNIPYCHQHSTIYGYAASYGKLEIIKQLYETCKLPFTECSVSNAMIANNVDIVKYILENCKTFDLNKILQESTTCLSFESLIFLKKLILKQQ
jgi:hypothetical protein